MPLLPPASDSDRSDRPGPLDWISEELAERERAGLLRVRREVTPLSGGKCRIAGRELWNFAANDYLGLADDPRLIAAARGALEEGGTGARASALVTGRTPWHVALEQRLARFKHSESAILFPTGYAANLGTIVALAGPGDAVYCDRLNHASLVDACRLSGAKFRVYPHVDVAALAKDLSRSGESRRRLIVTDSIFSMDGDLAPLPELLALAVEHEALLVVDEAHATGVLGAHGSGAAENLRTSGRFSDSDLRRVVAVGTLSKAVGVQGGFVAGSRDLCDWLWNSARTQVYSTALPPPLCAAAIAALDVIESEPERREWLLSAAERVRESLRRLEWNVPDGGVGPIVPILTGTAERTMLPARDLEERGVLVAAIRPPTVPRDGSRLRLSLSFAHGEEGVAALVSALAAVKRGQGPGVGDQRTE